MRFAAILFILLLLPAACVHEATAMSQLDIDVSSRVIPQGDLSLIRIKAQRGQAVQVTWQKKQIPLIHDPEKSLWQGFLAADLQEKPGRYKVVVNLSPSGHEEQFDIEVVNKDYGVRRLTLPKEMVDLDSKTLKRVRKESGIMKGIWDSPASAPAWDGRFLRPVQGDVIGPFGRRSIINNQPRSPHTGVDLRGKKDTPIKAVNNGRVVLTADHFFTEKLVVLDHGGEIMSMYFHLDKVLVKQDDVVRKGDIIGLVGSTGRATGPHLHWGMRVNGARVNPLSLISLSQTLEE